MNAEDRDISAVRVDEIQWTLAPIDRREDVDALALTTTQLLERVASLEADVRIYRELAQLALHQLHENNVAADRAQFRIHQLLGELRLSRDQVRTLGAQVRAQQGQAA